MRLHVKNDSPKSKLGFGFQLVQSLADGPGMSSRFQRGGHAPRLHLFFCRSPRPGPGS